MLKRVEAHTHLWTGFLTGTRLKCKLRSTLSVLFVIALSTAFPLCLPAQSSPQGSDLKVFDFASDPNFRNYKRVVTEFAHKHRPRSDNDFCIAGYFTQDGLKSVWVIWRQKRKIILWEGETDLDSSRRILDLKSDVVATDDDLHGSTYLVTREWVRNINGICNQSGVNVHVPKM